MTYQSVDQETKDVLNGILAKNVLARNGRDCIVTLDDVGNGTCRALAEAGYQGSLRAVQRNVDILSDQLVSGSALFGSRFSVHRGDICKDFVKLATVWAHPHNVDLYNFDLMGTFHGEPTLLVENIYKTPVGMNMGSLVAFTFQAIANGNILTKLKNLEGWKERIRLYGEMKNWKRNEIAKYYIDQMATIMAENKPSCVSVTPVPLGGGTYETYENCLVYGHSTKKHASTMIFMLYEFRHDVSCEHKIADREEEEEVITVGGKRKRPVGNDVDAHVVIEAEEMAFESGGSSDDESFHCAKSARTEVDESCSESEDMSVDQEDSDYSDSDDDDMHSLLGSSGDESFDMTCVPSLSGQQVDMSQLALFPHQLKMVEAVDRTIDRGYVKAICGSGKSLAMRTIDRGYVKAICGSGKSLAMVTCCKKVTTSVIFVPFKTLVEQFGDQYFATDADVDCHRVNSDHLGAVEFPKDGRCTVYVANYDSAHRIIDLGLKFDLICWDEAHLTTSKKRRERLNEEGCETLDVSELKLEANKSIFWTATPNRVMKEAPEIYGEEMFSYSFSDAVRDKIIKSFSLFISCYKDDSGVDDTPDRKFTKIVEQIVKFVQGEECKRILVYVNRVSEKSELLSVSNMKKRRELFPAEFQMDFLSAAIGATAREKIFKRFRKADNRVHVIVSCRTISVGVDLPTCDAVCFAGGSNNAIECTQRVCRPVRLTPDERASGEFEKAKIFFPVNASSVDFCELRDSAARNDAIHKAIRGHALEVPMTILDLLKQGLDVEYEFSRDGVERDLGTEKEPEPMDVDFEEVSEGEVLEGGDSEKIHVDLTFPYSDHQWSESSEDFGKSMNHLVVSMQKQVNPILQPYYDGDEAFKSSWMTDYINDNLDGKKPKQGSKDEIENVLARRLRKLLERKSYEALKTDPAYTTLRQFDWWNEAVEGLLVEKVVNRILEPYYGGDEAFKSSWMATYINENLDREKPKKGQDEIQTVLARRLEKLLNRKSYEALKTDPAYTTLRQFDWWNEAVEGILVEKVVNPILQPYYEGDDAFKSSWMASYINENLDGKRPKTRKDEIQTVLARRLEKLLKRKNYENYKKLKTKEAYSALRQFGWWNEAVEGLLVEKIVNPILQSYYDGDNGFKSSWMATYINEHLDGKRPKKGKDEIQYVLAGRLSRLLIRNNYEKLKTGIEYTALRQFDWWNDAVEKLLEK